MTEIWDEGYVVPPSLQNCNLFIQNLIWIMTFASYLENWKISKFVEFIGAILSIKVLTGLNSQEVFIDRVPY